MTTFPMLRLASRKANTSTASRYARILPPHLQPCSLRSGVAALRSSTAACFSTTSTDQEPLSSSSSSNNNNNNHDDNDDNGKNNDSDLRSRLLQSALQHVPEYGWTTQAIVAAVRHNHPTASLSLATTLTATDLVQCFMNQANQQLRHQLQQVQQQQRDNDNNNDYYHVPRLARIEQALRWRLEQVLSYKAMGRWHQGMALGISNPQAAWTTTQQLKELIDIVVQETAAVPRNNNNENDDDNEDEWSSDLAKLSLGAVYVATECHLLADNNNESMDYQDTWDFLHTQLQHWNTLWQQQQQQSLNGLVPNLSDAAFLASTLATAFGNGIWSVSTNGSASSPPSPDQVWQKAVETVNHMTSSTSNSSRNNNNNK